MSRGKVFALIPARGGSKGMPKKNISPLRGYPLIAFSIVAAKLCSGIERAIVSTDSPEIADIARFYGADVPFLRPPELAQDDAPDIDFVRHALGWLETHEGSVTQIPFIWKHPQFSFVFKIINCTVGGKLEVFKRQKLEDVVGVKNPSKPAYMSSPPPSPTSQPPKLIQRRL